MVLDGDSCEVDKSRSKIFLEVWTKEKVTWINSTLGKRIVKTPNIKYTLGHRTSQPLPLALHCPLLLPTGVDECCRTEIIRFEIQCQNYTC